MGEPGYVGMAAPSMPGPSLFDHARINSIQGGNFQAIHGGIHHSHTVNVHNQLPLGRTQEDIIDEVVALLQKLAFDVIDFRSIHEDIVNNKTRNTGETFKVKREVQGWLNRGNKVLWVTGGPGTGKTYLSCAFVQWLESRAEDSTQGNVAVVTLYLRFSETLTAYDITLAIIIQLVQWSDQLPAVADTVKEALKRRGPRRTGKPTFDDLVQLLKTIVALFEEVDICIDGIDEMPEKIQWPIVQTITSTEARVLFTSRPIHFLEAQLKEHKGEELVIIDFVAPPEDLDLFIGGVIDESPSLAALLKVNNAKEDVMKKIKDKAAGMFLHASLQVELLRNCRTLHAVDEMIEQFPPTIEDLYERTLKRVPEGDVALVRLILVWLLHVKGNLAIDDLQHAIAVNPETYHFDPKRVPSEGDIISICRGMLKVTVENQTRHIRLVHYTAYESLSKLLSDYTPHPHVVITHTCITRLIDCGFQNSAHDTLYQLDESFKNTPFLQYAHKNVGHHIQESLLKSRDHKTIIDTFVHGCESFPYLPYGVEGEGGYRVLNKLKPLHVAALFGMTELVVELLGQPGSDVNLRAGSNSGWDDKFDGWTSIMIAAHEGHTEVVEVLLRDVAVDLHVSTHTRQTPLILASERSHKAIVMMLADVPGIKINAQDINGDTALILVAHRGYTAVVNHLLAIPGIDVNHQSRLGTTSLTLAAMNGYEDTVKALLDVPDIDINLHDQNGWSPITVASEKGNNKVVQILTNNPGLEINKANEDGMTALLYASMSGRTEVVKTLLGVDGIDVNQASSGGSTPVLLASRHGYEAVLKALLGVEGVDFNRQDSRGSTALSVASDNGHIAIVDALLDLPGIDLDQPDNFGMTALLRASQNGHIAVVKSLLATDVDVNRRSKHGATALSLAAVGGHEDVVMALLGVSGIDISVQDNNGWSAIGTASANGYNSIVKALANAPDVDINQSNEDGMTALLYAAQNGHTLVVETLLDIQGINVNQVSKGGSSPLLIASVRGFEAVVKALLAVDGVDVNRKDTRGWSPLSIASGRGYSAVVDVLLKVPGIDFNSINDYGMTPLLHASQGGHTQVVKALLGTAIDINHTCKAGSTALTLASMDGYVDVVNALLGVDGIDINIQDNNGWSPMALASDHGHVAVVKALALTPGLNINQSNEDGMTALLYASQSRRTEVVNVLLEIDGIDVNQASKGGSTPLLMAAARGDEATVKALLSVEGVDVNRQDSRGWSPLSIGSRQGHHAVVDLLLAVREIDVNQTNNLGMTPLLYASERGQTAVVKSLLAACGTTGGESAVRDLLAIPIPSVDTDPPPNTLPSSSGHNAPGLNFDINRANHQGTTALLYASQNGHNAVVQALLGVQGTDVNQMDNIGVSPLIYAAALGHLDVVKSLLSSPGIQVNLQEPEGWSAAMRAAYRGHITVVELFLSHPEVDLKLLMPGGDTIVLFALSYHLQKYHSVAHRDDQDPQPVVLLLLDHPEIQTIAHLPNNEGWTPLIMASRFGYVDVVERLLTFSGVEVGAMTKDGQTALKIALDHGHGSVVKVLLDAGAVAFQEEYTLFP